MNDELASAVLSYAFPSGIDGFTPRDEGLPRLAFPFYQPTSV
jgi:hypothetical protein